ncbi:MAG: IPT/TIG domain-containing protein, partial [Candidatus Marinimicrobia bacterium]|nr:IPT/TIG domain-containing protein [Candidatus Neomarinimicrobiota bacterium]
MKKTLMSLSLILIVVLALTGCYEWPDPIWNPDDTGLPTPTISSVDVTALLGGIDNITITGTGFGDAADEVLVYFKKGTTVGRGRTIAATNTELIVEAPATYSDSLEIWVDRRGCFEYAKYTTNLITISSGLNMIPLVTESPKIKIAINESGDMWVALGANKNMFFITADDSVTLVNDVSFSGTMNVLAMRSAGSDLYYTLREYIVKYDGAVDRHKVNPDKNPLNDFAFANNGKIYLVSENKIYSTDHDMTNEAVAILDTNYKYTKCEVYDDKLYTASTYVGGDTLRSLEKSIMAYPINTDGSLGTVEEIINWTDDFAGSIISSITFDSDD